MKNFKLSKIVQLLRLAHMMQLKSLAEDTANFIIEVLELQDDADEAFFVFDLFVQHGNTVGITACSKSEVCTKKLLFEIILISNKNSVLFLMIIIN